MKSTIIALALAASAWAMPQGVTTAVPAQAPAPSGCSDTASGTFQITPVNVTSSAGKRAAEKRQLAGTLTLSLNKGVLKDQAGRTGYIAANFQYQFDNPPQTGALITSGFSLCSNGSLALGGSAIWWVCPSGEIRNIYDRKWADHCYPSYLQSQKGGSPGPVTQTRDGQPQAPTGVTQISDGQPQAPSGVVTQITDGQPQAPTGVVTQISDGQPQAPTGGVVTQISDGQPQAPTGGAPITQISDGQPQAPAPTGPVVTQISDGQPQAPTGPAVTQITDGQPQAPVPTSNFTQTALPPFTGAAASPTFYLGAMAAGALGIAAFF